jgi:capsular exopolysaccharide synthesis family protein
VSDDEISTGRSAPRGMTLTEFVSLAKTYWKGILAATLLVTVLAYGWTLLQPKIYSSQSSGIVVAAGANNLGLSLAGDNLAKSKAKNYKSVASSRLVAERVLGVTGMDISADALLKSVSVSIPLDTSEISVVVESTDPASAQRLADEWVTALAAQVSEIENAAGGDAAASSAVRVVPLGKAVLPAEPISPNLRLALLVGALGGLVLGLLYALVRNHLDRRIRKAEEIEAGYGVPVIGTLPVDHRLNGKSSILDSLQYDASPGGSHNAISEALRELRTNLSFVDVDNPPRIIVVTSSVPSEGKTTVTANLAVTIAAAGENVVVVDGDLRRPTVADVFGLVPRVGVTDVLSGHASVDDVLQQWGALPNLQVLGSGPLPPNPSELLGSKAMRHLLKSLSANAIVLVDAPPLLPVTDAAVLSRAADGVIMVVRSGKTTREELTKALDNIKRVKSRVLGSILNYLPITTSGAYSYYGTYSSKGATAHDTGAILRETNAASPTDIASPRPDVRAGIQSLPSVDPSGAAPPRRMSVTPRRSRR